jgi:iron complex transport system ATP-binding protein
MQIDQPPDPDVVIDCRGVRVVKGGRAVVQDIAWTVRARDRWVVIGPNGAGKSSLLDVVSARAQPAAGEAWLLGERLGLVDVFDLRPRIGVVGPAVAAAIQPRERVLDVVLTAAWGTTGHWREEYRPVDIERAEALLARMGAAALRDRAFGTLSDGERKRVLVARALMPDPEVLILDEPAAGLDLGAREGVVSMLAGLAADPAAPAIVLVTHHVEEIPQQFTHAMLLAQGAVVAAGPLPEVVTGAALGRTFGTPIQVGRYAGRYFAVASRAGAAAAVP